MAALCHPDRGRLLPAERGISLRICWRSPVAPHPPLGARPWERRVCPGSAEPALSLPNGSRLPARPGTTNRAEQCRDGQAAAIGEGIRGRFGESPHRYLSRFVHLSRTHGTAAPSADARNSIARYAAAVVNGPLMPPQDQDACLFPRRFGGRSALIHRPMIRGEAHIWISCSPDLKHWTSGCLRQARLTSDSVTFPMPSSLQAQSWIETRTSFAFITVRPIAR